MQFLGGSLVYPPQNVHLDPKSEKNRKKRFFTENSTRYRRKNDSYKKNQENRQKRPFMPDILGTCMVLIAEMIISNCREDIE